MKFFFSDWTIIVSASFGLSISFQNTCQKSIFGTLLRKTLAQCRQCEV
ncbi:MAG: hypothetical protein HYV28_02525 [Ignavibacteriales bacterium]|nr:hypothetical protein [Ignavibacteriales bacterium]